MVTWALDPRANRKSHRSLSRKHQMSDKLPLIYAIYLSPTGDTMMIKILCDARTGLDGWLAAASCSPEIDMPIRHHPHPPKKSPPVKCAHPAVRSAKVKRLLPRRGPTDARRTALVDKTDFRRVAASTKVDAGWLPFDDFQGGSRAVDLVSGHRGGYVVWNYSAILYMNK